MAAKSYVLRSKSRRAVTFKASEGVYYSLTEGTPYLTDDPAILAARHPELAHVIATTIGEAHCTRVILVFEPPVTRTHRLADGTVASFRDPVLITDSDDLYAKRAMLPDDYEVVEVSNAAVVYGITGAVDLGG